MITMAEIAKRAGVSRATASLVINDRDAAVRISPATRQRVLAVAEEMGYRRNDLARAVVTGKNFVLGLLDREAGLEQKALILSGALAEADAHGYQVKIWPCHSQERMNEMARRCVEQRITGLIVMGWARTTLDGLYQELTRYDIPLVLVDDSQESRAITVASDDAQGARLALEHLIGLGHRRIACITGTHSHILAAARERNYREIMREYGLPVPEGYVFYNCWSEFEETEAHIRHLFSQGKEWPTALFVAAGDPYAAIAVRVLRGMGIPVPQQVSVVGYADLDLAKVVDPPLTTVAQPFMEMGSVAVQVLMSIIQQAVNPHVPAGRDRLLPTRLVLRASTAPPPKPHNLSIE